MSKTIFNFGISQCADTVPTVWKEVGWGLLPICSNVTSCKVCTNTIIVFIPESCMCNLLLLLPSILHPKQPFLSVTSLYTKLFPILSLSPSPLVQQRIISLRAFFWPKLTSEQAKLSWCSAFFCKNKPLPGLYDLWIHRQGLLKHNKHGQWTDFYLIWNTDFTNSSWIFPHTDCLQVANTGSTH